MKCIEEDAADGNAEDSGKDYFYYNYSAVRLNNYYSYYLLCKFDFGCCGFEGKPIK